jgi:hypothetical protein
MAPLLNLVGRNNRLYGASTYRTDAAHQTFIALTTDGIVAARNKYKRLWRVKTDRTVGDIVGKDMGRPRYGGRRPLVRDNNAVFFDSIEILFSAPR